MNITTKVLKKLQALMYGLMKEARKESFVEFWEYWEYWDINYESH